MAAPRVLVTRPAQEAGRWTEELRRRGIAAESLPLIDIAPLPDPAPLQAAWREAHRHFALMFVSANAVQHFMAARPAGLPLPAQAWGTGPGTQAALLAAGWPAGQIRCPAAGTGKFDSEALWELVQGQVHEHLARHARDSRPGAHGPSVLIVRGADAQGQLAGRDWLAAQLLAAGLQVAQCVAYARRVPVLGPAARARALEALSDGSWWLFSSAEAAQNLALLLPGAIGLSSRALATHPRIAERLRQQGWGRVEQVSPLLD